MSSKMKTKDVITVVLMSLINIVIFGFGTFFYLTPITILLMPVFYSLFQGIVFFMIGAKVQKKGAFFLYAVIQGVVGFNVPYILMWLLGGLVSELVLARTGYTDTKGLTISYTAEQLLAAFGSTIYPYALALSKTLENMKGSTGELNVYIEKAGHMIQGWGMLVLILAIILASVIGSFFGKKVMEKHLLKAKRTEEEDNA